MFKVSIFKFEMMSSSAASFTSGGFAETARMLADSDDYPRMALAMKEHGYDWEAFKVTTEDNYILTTFHILGKTGQDRPIPLKIPVLC